MTQKTSQRGATALGLLLALLAIGALFYFTFNKQKVATVTVGQGGTEEVREVKQSEAKGHVVSQMCLNDCTSETRVCRATALDPEAKAACTDKAEDCAAACEGGGQ